MHAIYAKPDLTKTNKIILETFSATFSLDRFGLPLWTFTDSSFIYSSIKQQLELFRVKETTQEEPTPMYISH